jgi:hypothetical protein
MAGSLLQNELDALLGISSNVGPDNVPENAVSGPCLEGSEPQPGAHEAAPNRASRKSYILGKISTAGNNETLLQEDLDRLLTY